MMLCTHHPSVVIDVFSFLDAANLEFSNANTLENPTSSSSSTAHASHPNTMMYRGTTNLSAARSLNRVRPCGPTIKTTVQDMDTSNHKSPAITSTDWRKRAAAVSSPPLNAKGKQPVSYDENEDVGMRLDSENSFSAPQYRYPRDKRAPWETVFSAPAWQQPSSSSSISGDNHRETTKVQLKHVSPIVTKVDGEEITMPNRFSFEVSVVDQNNAPLGVAVGELKPFDRSTPFRRIPTEDSETLLNSLQNIVNRQSVCNQDMLNSVPSSSSESHGYSQLVGLEEQESSPGAATPESSDAEAEPSRAHARLREEEARFQMMLRRLENRPASSSSLEADSAPRQPHGVVDPAIVAMKVKGKPDTEAANKFFAQKLSEMQDKGKQKASDSGYASNNRSQHSNNRSGSANARSDFLYDSIPTHKGSCDRSGVFDDRSDGSYGCFASHFPRKEPSLDDGQNKALNPAAAEFKSVAQTDDVPWLSAKKMSRPPLTNVFPDATTSHLSRPHSILPDAYFGPSRQATGPAVAGPSNENRAFNHRKNSPLPDALFGPSLPTTASAVAEPSNGNRAIDEYVLAQASGSTNPRPHQIRPSPGFAATVSPVTLPGSGLLAAAPPSATSSNAAVNGTFMPLSGLNAFNTFPPAAGTTTVPMPVFSQAAVATTSTGLNNVYVPVTSLPSMPYPPGLAPQFQQPQQQSLPLAGPPGLTNAGNNMPPAQVQRPYFPVTTKPRDHDPVKQQQYEAYLEWRKANEPGYHLGCKVRQAQRVVRQYQQQQQLMTAVAGPATAAALEAGATFPTGTGA
ncbi:hypothetical protein N657DRAFT_509591 [Parathielavia appendiculata]|uniref:Uncharacterized protein n=1 Tax=Parathielavia appendiculata TaxID=2587402 RepID=A0AAN6TXS4_9PEZI|nr:hypothetical protein N657DRAFT_509591 [Parathielavia appendiculata]